MKYRTSKHQKYLLLYHIVLVTKYRKPILDIKLTNKIKELIWLYSIENKVKIEELEVDKIKKDHIHMLLNFPIELDVKTYLIRLKRLITYTVYRNQDFLYELRKVYKNKK